jgi:saccharopine dehydrogenase (NAD+, L-lysine-forming)
LRVAVLGAGGTIAPAIVRDLATSEEVGSLLLLDLDRERAEAVAREQGGGKAEAREADATGALAEQLSDADALVNSASYRINLAAMRACLAAGCHYLDLGGLYHVAAEQLRLSDEFEGAGLIAILGIGSAPGKTNLLAARAVEELGSTPDAISVAAAGRDLEPPDGLSFPYAVQTLIDEVTMAPMAISGGAPIELEPMQDGGAVDFGEPIGEEETIYTLHSEILTFGDSFGCESATFRLSLPPPALAGLRELIGAGDERVAEVARSASPQSPDTVAVHLVEVVSGGAGVRARSVTRPHREWGLGGGIVSTASPAAAAVRLLARDRVQARGALPPESCLDPREMFTELERCGVAFEIQSYEPTGPAQAQSLA